MISILITRLTEFSYTFYFLHENTFILELWYLLLHNFFPINTCDLVCLRLLLHLSAKNIWNNRNFKRISSVSYIPRENWQEQKYISYEVQNLASSIYSEVFWKTSDNFSTLSSGTFMSVATQSLPRPFIFRRIFQFEAIAIYRVGFSKQKPSTIFMKWNRYMYKCTLYLWISKYVL